MTGEKLFDLYKIAVEEYRFQVRYNWDRNKFYILLTLTLISIATGLLKILVEIHLELLMTPLFGSGAIVALIGFNTLKKGHEYYRKTVLKMAELESQLNLSATEQPIVTTAGMQESKVFLSDPKGFVNRPFRLGTINYFLAALFILLMVANGLGIVFVLLSQYSLLTLSF